MVGIYVRVSSEQQVEGISLDVQKQIGINWCNSNNKEYKIFEDAGKSGGSITKRDGYQDLIEEIISGYIDEIWVRDLWRLNRENKNSIDLRLICFDKKVKIYEDGKLYDFNNSENVLMYDMFNSIGEYYRKYSGKMSVMSRKRMLSDGKYILGSVLFGYELVNGRLRIVDKEVEIIKFVYDLMDNNRSIKGIVKELRIKYGVGEYFRMGKNLKFSDGWVSKLINNETYYSGILKVKFDNDDFEFKIEPILNKDYWVRVNDKWKNGFRKRESVDIGVYNDLIYCYVCNRKCHVFSQNGWKKKDGTSLKYYYLNCNNTECRNYRRNVIDIRNIEIDFKIFMNNIMDGDRKIKIEDFKDKLNIMYGERVEKIEKVDYKKIVNDIEILEEELGRLKKLYVMRDLSEEEYLIEKENRLNRLEEYNKVLYERDNKVYNDELILKYLEEINKLNVGISDDEFIERFIDRIYIRVIRRDYFEKGRLIKYKVDWKDLDLILEGKKKSNKNLLTKNQSKTFEEILIKRNLGVVIEFEIINFKFKIDSLYFNKL